MKFVWDMTEEKFDEMKDFMKNGKDGLWETHEDVEFFGCVRSGEVCIDINAWCALDDAPPYLEFSMYVGGIGNYGYSKVDETHVWNYDHVDYYTGFEIKDMSYSEFKQATEVFLKELIKKANETYDEADLVAEANKPLHVW